VAGEAQPVVVRGERFAITCYGTASQAETLLKDLTLRFAVYNRLFRFPVERLTEPLVVLAYANEAQYNAFVRGRIGVEREGAVYLHYKTPSQRCLIVNLAANTGASFPHQAFIQFLRAFVAAPPAWVRDGFAIYFSTLRFDTQTRSLAYDENLAWLETAKALLHDGAMPPIKAVMLADAKRIPPEHFAAASWSLASFFLNKGGTGDYFRSLTEGFMLLKPDATATQNARAIYDRLVEWSAPEQVEKDYTTYLTARSTFADAMQQGRQAYNDTDYDTAEKVFLDALSERPEFYVPYYYLGLIAYAKGDYTMAEKYYRSAQAFGAPDALIAYALGVNYAACGRVDDALESLRAAATADSAHYARKCDNLIAKLARAP
jgi:hypothetical protein